jgi:hypothetical protein
VAVASQQPSRPSTRLLLARRMCRMCQDSSRQTERERTLHALPPCLPPSRVLGFHFVLVFFCVFSHCLFLNALNSMGGLDRGGLDRSMRVLRLHMRLPPSACFRVSASVVLLPLSLSLSLARAVSRSLEITVIQLFLG